MFGIDPSKGTWPYMRRWERVGAMVLVVAFYPAVLVETLIKRRKK